MLVPIALLLGLASLVDANAIKGHALARPLEEGRSIKLAPAAKSMPVVQQAPAVPIWESSKKVYNDESIRRLAAPVVEQAAALPVVVAPVKPAEQPVVVPASPSVQVPQQAAPAPDQPVVPKDPVPAVVAPKSAPVEQPQVAPVVAAPAKSEELPPQSDRSVPVREELPAPSPVVVAAAAIAEPVAPVKVVEQPAPVAPVVPKPQAPVQPEVVAEPAVVKESPLQAKKDEVPVPNVEPLHIEVPAPDPGLVLSEPIDSTTKLLIDLDEHVQKFLPAEEQQQPQAAKDQHLVAGVDYSPSSGVVAAPANPTGKSSGPLAPYSGADEPIVPPLPSLDGVEKASAGAPAQAAAGPTSASGSSSAASPSATRQGGHQNQNQQQVITQLLDQLDSLQNRIQDTINQLVARRRYVMSALLRPMGTYVRRVRTNLERLQNRVNQLQAAAVSVGGGQNRPGGFVDAAAIETIRRRIDDISKRISDIVNRIRFSLTPTSAPLNSNGRK